MVDHNKANTTEAAAIGAWHILHAFLERSPQLDADMGDRTFNSESYARNDTGKLIMGEGYC